MDISGYRHSCVVWDEAFLIAKNSPGAFSDYIDPYLDNLYRSDGVVQHTDGATAGVNTMKTFEVLIQMMFICNRIVKGKIIRIVLHPDFSGHMSYEYESEAIDGEHRLFSWGENYSHLLQNFVSWLEKHK